ncbi:MAG: hypothetical protein Fur0037_05410 [Planctomycetota bacterium]
MKLEPVYLVAPDPPLSSIPTRRAFLWAGIGTLAGFAGGLGCATAPGVLAGEAARDPVLLWLHRLCDEAPVDDLIRYRAALLQQLPRHVSDPVLWHGMARLAVSIPGIEDATARKRAAEEFVDVARRLEPLSPRALAVNLPTLEEIDGR